MAGIREVARRAGLSVGTVSRVINHHPSVTPEVRARVEAIIAELGYRPDPFARSMRSKQSRLIGIVIPDLSNPFFAELVQNAERAATQAGYSVLFMTSLDEAHTEADRIASLASRKVDGIVIVPAGSVHSAQAPQGIPMIVVDRLMDAHPGVAADNRAGARLAVEYLVGLGHRRIACIAGPQGSLPARERLQGYRDVVAASAALGLQYEDSLVAECAFDFESGRRGGMFLLARPRGERPSAIFTSSDPQAIGCLRAANDLGIPVPAGLSIVGFDGIPLSNLITPRLTTVQQPIAEMADAAIAALVGLRALPEVGRPLLLDCALVERESCAPPLQLPG